MSLQGRLSSLITAIGADIKALRKLTSRLTASVANSTVTYASTGLSITLEAGKTYEIKAFGQFQSAATTTGIGLRLGGTATATRIRYNIFIYGMGTANTLSVRSPTSINGSPTASPGVAAAATEYPWTIEGLIVVNAGGTLTVDFMSEVAGSAVTIQSDSYLEVQEVT